MNFRRKKYLKVRNRYNNLNFPALFSALTDEQERPGGQNGRPTSVKKLRDNSKCCIEFSLWNIFLLRSMQDALMSKLFNSQCCKNETFRGIFNHCVLRLSRGRPATASIFNASFYYEYEKWIMKDKSCANNESLELLLLESSHRASSQRRSNAKCMTKADLFLKFKGLKLRFC